MLLRNFPRRLQKSSLAALQHCCFEKKTLPEDVSTAKQHFCLGNQTRDLPKLVLAAFEPNGCEKTLKPPEKFVWPEFQQHGFENVLKHSRNCRSRNSTLLLPKQPKPYLKHVVVATQENCSGKISKLFYNFALTTFQKFCFGFLLRHFQCFVLAAIPHCCFEFSPRRLKMFFLSRNSTFFLR